MCTRPTAWRGVLESVVSRYRGRGRGYIFEATRPSNPDIYQFLEVEGMAYAIRLRANMVLQEEIGYLLKRPVGRPPHEDELWQIWKYRGGCGATGGQVGLSLLDKQIGFG